MRRKKLLEAVSGTHAMKWQYWTQRIGNGQLTEKMDELGAEGWELVAVLEWGDANVMCFFKRPRSGQGASDG
jgi:hypothetical protein